MNAWFKSVLFYLYLEKNYGYFVVLSDVLRVPTYYMDIAASYVTQRGFDNA